MSRPLVTLALALLLGCGGREDAGPAELVARPVKVFVVGVESTGLVGYLPGVVKAPTSTPLSFEVDGRIREFPVREGQGVTAGTVIARLDPRDYQADLTSMQARAAAAKAEYDRQREQLRQDATSQAKVDEARRNYQVLGSQLSVTQKALDEAVLVAPYDGVVARKLVDDFANIKAKEPIVLLDAAGDLEVEVNLSEVQYARFSGRPAGTTYETAVTIGALPGLEFPARVKEFSTRADPTTRAFAVTLVFDADPGLTILPGMTAMVRATPASEGTMAPLRLVPARAVLIDEQGEFVWTLDPEAGVARRTSVALGVALADLVTVESGLEDGDVVAISGLPELREGLPVRPWVGVPR